MYVYTVVCAASARRGVQGRITSDKDEERKTRWVNEDVAANSWKDRLTRG